MSNRNACFLDLVLSKKAATLACTYRLGSHWTFDLSCADNPDLDKLSSLLAPIVFKDRSEDHRTLDFRRIDYADISAGISSDDGRPLDSTGCVDYVVEYFHQMIWDIMAEYVHIDIARPMPKPLCSNSHLRRLKR